MKTTVFIVCVIIFAKFLAFNSSAQEQPAMPETFYIIEEFVAPPDLQAFSETQQKAVDMWNELAFEFPVYTYQTAENSFYWVLPIENFAGIDALYQQVGVLTAEMKESGFDAEKEFKDLSTSRSMIIHWMEELSYHPNGNTGQAADKPFCEWTFISLRAGHEAEAADVVQKYIEFYNSIEEDESWDVYNVSIGSDLPMWVLMFTAESELAMREQEKLLGDKYKADFEKLWNEFSVHIRKYEIQKGWFLPKWSMNTEQ
ncbi:MAG TPA: hypothetical protein VEP89_12020 [Draconibacterium sp.]|nr:hypothetical protein [Draconibacterium sp.]